jgi:hypothetical protein
MCEVDCFRERIDEILELWETLQKQTEFKGNKLKEASQQQQFNRNVEDIETWLSEIEGQLMSEDYGKVCVGGICMLYTGPAGLYLLLLISLIANVKIMQKFWFYCCVHHTYKRAVDPT